MNTPQTMPSLLPCPLCNGPAYPGTVTYGENSDFVKLNHQRESHFINCANCGCQCGEWLTLQAASEKWNRRASPSPTISEETPSQRVDTWAKKHSIRFVGRSYGSYTTDTVSHAALMELAALEAAGLGGEK